METVSRTQKWTPKRQGDAGELSAICWLTSVGAEVARPMFHGSGYDLIAHFPEDGRTLLVRVKTSTCWSNGRYEVALATRGGNQSWNGVVKLLDATCCDALFVHCGDGRRWFIPSEHLSGGSKLLLGGPKYAGYEVSSGEPLQARTDGSEQAGGVHGER